jgi:hypothetical protein
MAAPWCQQTSNSVLKRYTTLLKAYEERFAIYVARVSLIDSMISQACKEIGAGLVESNRVRAEEWVEKVHMAQEATMRSVVSTSAWGLKDE